MRRRVDSETILLTNFYGDFGGGEFALLNHAQFLRDQNRKVHVLLFHSGAIVDRLKQAGCGVTIHRCRLDCGPRGVLLTTLKLQPFLVTLIRRVSPRYVLVYTMHELPFVAKAARWCRVPVFYRDQSSGEDAENGEDWRFRWLTNKGGRLLSHVIPTTQARRNYLLSCGLNAEDVSTVYLGIDSSGFQNSATDRKALRSELGASQDDCLIGLFGRLIAWKGQETFLRALASTEGNFRAVIVGGPQLNERDGKQYVRHLTSLTRELGIADHVRFTGFRDDVAQLMAACDIVAHASVREPFGLVIAEAAMCGKPVVASDVSGPQEIIVPGETGLLFDPTQPSQMSIHLDRLISDSAMRSRMGAAARQRALDCFELQKNLRELDNLMETKLTDSVLRSAAFPK